MIKPLHIAVLAVAIGGASVLMANDTFFTGTSQQQVARDGKGGRLDVRGQAGRPATITHVLNDHAAGMTHAQRQRVARVQTGTAVALTLP